MAFTVALRRRLGVERPRAKVALVGREQSGSENLSLRYLAAALSKAGHRPLIVPLSGPGSLPDAAARIERLKPALVGLSMPDSDVTIDALAFAHYLRSRGYEGHITCGGPLATLVRHELLNTHPGIDSVIRHDGELPLTELAYRIAAREPWHDIAGISTRQGDGPPAPVADPTPMATRPLHADPLPRVIGLPTARLAASRGCPGRCPYCGPAALQREAVAEGKKAGLSRKALSEVGVGATRYRHATDVAEEVAELYHQRGARFFQVVDENLLSGSAERAESWLESLMAELACLDVGKTAWCLQADPATLSPRILDLLERLGTVRVSVGIEGLTSPQRRALGRTGEAAAHIDLLKRLTARGFVANFNSLIVHPDSTAEGIACELEALAALPPVHFDVLSMAVYPGTQAHRALLREGRVTGGMLSMRFEPKEVAVKRFRAALIRLRLQALGRYAANVFAHDVAINVALARHFALPGYDVSLERELSAALPELNRIRLRAFNSALALAVADVDDDRREMALASIIASLKHELAPVLERVARIQCRLEGSAGGRIAPSNLMIASAMATGFVLCLSTTACGGQVDSESGRQSQPPTDAMAMPSSTAAGSGGMPSGGSGGEGAASGQGGAGGLGQGGVAGSPLPGTGATAGASPVPDSGVDEICLSAEQDRMANLLGAAGCTPCNGDPYIWIGDESYSANQIVIDPAGRFVDVIAPNGEMLPMEVRACYARALAGQAFPCLSGERLWYECLALLL